MKMIMMIFLTFLCCACNSRFHRIKWRIEPSYLFDDTVVQYEVEKNLKGDYIHIFGDSVKIKKSDLNSLIVNWKQYRWPPKVINDVSVTIDAKSSIDDISVYKVSITPSIEFNEDVAHVFYYSPQYGVIIKMRKIALLTNTFYSIISVNGRKSSRTQRVNFEKLVKGIYKDTVLFRRH